MHLPFTPIEATALHALGQFLADHGDEIEAEVLTEIARLPEWRDAPIQPREKRDLPLLRDAIEKNAWEPFYKLLRDRGTAFAKSGVDYLEWIAPERIFRDHVRKRIRAQMKPDNVANVMALGIGMQFIVDLRADTIGDAYFQEKRAHKVQIESQLQQAQKMDALGRLAGGVAHDFNNILTVIGSYACMLEDSLDTNDERHADATEIRLASERASTITRRLLALGRHSMVKPRVLQLDDVIAAFVPMLRRLVGERVRIEVQRGDGPPICGDTSQLEQILMNLAVNARDAMQGTGRLTIETSRSTLDMTDAAELGVAPGTYLTLAVTDTGGGMSAEVQKHIFDPFFTTKDVGQGTGLGLSIVHGIVTQAKGAITVYSQPGHGATFRIYLPVAENAIQPETPRAITAPIALPPVTVLVVDDDRELRVASMRVLRDAGCSVLDASSAAEARRLCVSHDGEIHVALIDVVLADGRGDLLARELRDLRASLQVVLMSGYPTGALGPSGDAPAGLLAKPFLPAQLREAVAQVASTSGAIRRSEPSLQPRVLLVDDDGDLRKMLSRVLKRASFDVEEVSSGRAALKRLDEKRFDVVLSDVHMPDGDGLEVVRGVRRHDLDLPVILMSGKPDVQSAATALEYGAFRYLTKPLDNETVERLVRQAARAHALARIRRQATTLSGTSVGASDRAGLEVRFDMAIAHMWMAFQPIIDAHTGHLYAVEALMRSREPSIPHPGALLEAADTLGKLPMLGRRVRQLSGDALMSRTDIPYLFVNLHPTDLLDIDLIREDAVLTRMASRVVLEVTERESLASSPELIERLARLREIGFRLAVDDIGAGYSGLTSFADLSPEVVKIDMSLIRAVHTSTRKQRTVAALCSLCHEVGAIVVGEGVETLEERACLIDLGCDLLQGYLLGKPVPQLPIT
ncbi:MAG TPA: EAL domain-containing protein [Kofleriaceae bacterium]|jgi:EAL domain-containing protein (putative c-di-GMP-specific phosphodiesterase class I)/signal transduction histidine kinase